MDKRPLRILYTINGAPQYILARSHAPVLITPFPTYPQDDSPKPEEGAAGLERPKARFASVSLKACLTTLVRSSPELVQDSTRDYSVYALDPTETDYNAAPANTASSSSTLKKEPPSQGIAVGLGLMSWALSAEDSEGMVINGTVVKLGNGQEVLEVFFSLREVWHHLHSRLFFSRY